MEQPTNPWPRDETVPTRPVPPPGRMIKEGDFFENAVEILKITRSGAGYSALIFSVLYLVNIIPLASLIGSSLPYAAFSILHMGFFYKKKINNKETEREVAINVYEQIEAERDANLLSILDRKPDPAKYNVKLHESGEYTDAKCFYCGRKYPFTVLDIKSHIDNKLNYYSCLSQGDCRVTRESFMNIRVDTRLF